MRPLTLLSVASPETQDVEGFLNNLSGLASELVVVDQGIDAASKAFLAQHGALFVEATDPRDASIGLNAGIARATCTWLLRLDTNERLSAEAKNAISLVMEMEDAGVGILGVSYDDRSNAKTSAWEIRLFRKNGATYRYPVEPDLIDSTLASLEKESLSQHFLSGTLFQLQPVAFAEAERRLLAMAEDKNHRMYALYRLLRLAQLYGDEELLDDAAERGERALEAADEKVLQTLSYAGAWLSALARHIFADDAAAQLGWLDSWAERIPTHAEFSYTRGTLCEHLGHTARARTEYTRCLSRGNPGLNAQFAMIRPTVALARLDMLEGRAEAALNGLDDVLAFAPKDPEALFSLASFARKLGGTSLSDELAQAYCETYGECVERHIAWGEAALWSGDQEQAVSELSAASLLSPEGNHTELLKRALSGAGPDDLPTPYTS